MLIRCSLDLKTFKCIMCFILGIFSCLLWQNFISQTLSYEDWKVLGTFFSGFGTFLTAVFIWIKWQEEKSRIWYQKRLKKVYSPLLGYFVQQETVRYTLLKDKKEAIFEEMPVLSGGPLDRENFVHECNQADYGYMTPRTLILINKYRMLLELEKNSQYYKNQLINHERYEVEKELIDNIIEEYNEVISHLGIDNDFIKYDDLT